VEDIQKTLKSALAEAESYAENSPMPDVSELLTEVYT
jgi:TPP-dependent pyruvate/acetoin dehydrogenase alpha subunit